MQIERVSIYQVELPFKVRFSHSLSNRSSGQNVIVEIVAQQGVIKGYGEGAPRSYVTGESQLSASKSISLFAQEKSFPWELDDVSQIWDFIDILPDEKNHNSAVCALESALLDALGKDQNRRVLNYFPSDFHRDTLVYGAPLPLASKENILIGCRIIREMGIRKLKLKLGTDLAHNKDILESVQNIFGHDLDLRVDINCVWDREMVIKHLPLFEQYGIRVVEQPMMPEDPQISEIAVLLKSAGIALMADESACTLTDVQRLCQEGYYEMVNIRLSKCGGFRKSLRIIDYMRQNGVAFQIGCHLGESGLLSAAGRALCLLCTDAVYHDGSYDEFLLKENITVEDVSFGPGGRATPLAGPGLGVKVNTAILRRLSDNAATITMKNP